ncbi:disulfide bond formation protein B [bacterium]|nr:disulfide bond formation protein B [bacterium]
MFIYNIFKISFLISSLMMSTAFYLEYFHGALPCDLCITQRWFHGAIITYSLIIILFFKKISISKNLLLFGGGILWLLSSVAGLYHFGIEMSFWIGPDGCSSNIDFSKDTLKYLLEKSPIKCDEVMFEIFGLSLAGWNAFASFFAFLLTNIFLLNKRLIKI